MCLMVRYTKDLPLTIATNKANIFLGCELVNLQFHLSSRLLRRYFAPDSNCLAALDRPLRSVSCVSQVPAATGWNSTHSRMILTAMGLLRVHIPFLALFERQYHLY